MIDVSIRKCPTGWYIHTMEGRNYTGSLLVSYSEDVIAIRDACNEWLESFEEKKEII